MREIQKYRLVRDTDESALEKEVNKLLGDGWQPHGSLVFAAASNKDQFDWFLQPMIKFSLLDDHLQALEDLKSEVSYVVEAIEAAVKKSMARKA